jgi:dolichol-phosphate mannosyltransferase
VPDPRSAPALLSVVVPVYCEQDVIGEFYARAKQVLRGLEPALAHELVFVNDGSSDRSPESLESLASVDPAVRVIELSRNFGHQIAITAGIDHSRGDAVVVIDCDLQDPPELIPAMVKSWREGFKVVFGVRRARRGESRFKRASAKLYNRLLARLSDLDIPVDSGEFRLMDADVVAALRQMREEDRYLRGLVSWVGFRQCALPYDRDPRYAGETRFGLARMLRLAIDGVTSLSDRPLRLASELGLALTVLSFAGLCWLLVGAILHPERPGAGFASVILVVFFAGGLQLLAIGILGEYVGRLFRQSRGRPLYVVARRLGS